MFGMALFVRGTFLREKGCLTKSFDCRTAVRRRFLYLIDKAALFYLLTRRRRAERSEGQAWAAVARE